MEVAIYRVYLVLLRICLGLDGLNLLGHKLDHYTFLSHT